MKLGTNGLAARFGIVSALIITLSGCGGMYDSSVSGVVTLDGSPLPRGTVCYIPTSAGPRAYGLILSDGSYYMKIGTEKGLPSGEYQVTVVSKEESIPTTPGMPPKPGKSITPPWYHTPRSSNLNQTVEAGSNEINLELSSEPPPNWKPPRKRKRR